jgi:hypothetical protein
MLSLVKLLRIFRGRALSRIGSQRPALPSKPSQSNLVGVDFSRTGTVLYLWLMQPWRSWILVYAAPAGTETPIAALLLDESNNVLYQHFRADLAAIAPEDIDLLELLEPDIHKRAREMGARECMQYMENTMSNVLRIVPQDPPLRVSDPGIVAQSQLESAIKRASLPS